MRMNFMEHWGLRHINMVPNAPGAICANLMQKAKVDVN